MPDSIPTQRLTRARRARALTTVILATGVVAGCGGSSPSSPSPARPPARTERSAMSSRVTNPATGGSAPLLAFAKCMRANGVSNFPDPDPTGGGFRVGAGVDLSSPAVRAAQAKCQRLLPGSLPGPGTTTHPSDQTLDKLLRIARCMRAHRISQFPDPRTSVPSDLSPGEYPEVTDFDGAILLFPRTINLEAPAYKQALAACGAPPLGLPH